jgi:hypothetical protein
MRIWKCEEWLRWMREAKFETRNPKFEDEVQAEKIGVDY